jgi:hypothetical protein
MIVTTRDITTAECPWLGNDIPAGTHLYRFTGITYGCISPEGTAVSEENGVNPFFEIPDDSFQDV